MNPNDLNSNIVVVTLDGKDLFLDPGTALVPFGTLPWWETEVSGLRITKDGGEWVTTPRSEPKNRARSESLLKLTSSGTLEGKLTVTYTGQEAWWRRLEEHDEDDADRKQFLEEQIKADIPSGSEVELVNRPDWDSASQISGRAVQFEGAGLGGRRGATGADAGRTIWRSGPAGV